jgi:hypothetical protein
MSDLRTEARRLLRRWRAKADGEERASRGMVTSDVMVELEASAAAHRFCADELAAVLEEKP